MTRASAHLLSLPACLLVLLSNSISHAAAHDALREQPILQMEIFTESPFEAKRGQLVQELLATRTPVGVRKSAKDLGGVFPLEYWQFDDEGEAEIARRLQELWEEEFRHTTGGSMNGEFDNATLFDLYLPPLRVHAADAMETSEGQFWRLFQRNQLAKRQFSCPADFSNCAAINRPNICCPNGATCISVSDTGIGDVGCCPQGASCSGQISNCDISQGYKSCPGSSNGGCCIPNYDCNGIGCVSTAVVTTTTTLPLATVSRATISSPQSSSTTSTTTPSTTSSTTSSRTSQITTTTTASASAPVRPIPSTTTSTSRTNPPAVAPTTITTTSSQIVAICPSNYYVCSAFYPPCCYTFGAACSAQSCPAYASTSTFVSNGVTVLIPGGGTLPASSASVTLVSTRTIVSGAGRSTDLGYLFASLSCVISIAFVLFR